MGNLGKQERSEGMADSWMEEKGTGHNSSEHGSGPIESLPTEDLAYRNPFLGRVPIRLASPRPREAFESLSSRRHFRSRYQTGPAPC
ncbi:hypothetical protein NliqN6_6811 [Naganishia liquefaciens]|uniref:Uncharacterized protein n=1 Tax=Naganishia liquefaciens TaxID=104408 RepID=A0A8H3U257_9TREE|nr:hypothetical protein NliqN6_6811 [Naganishia liquefaciens]